MSDLDDRGFERTRAVRGFLERSRSSISETGIATEIRVKNKTQISILYRRGQVTLLNFDEADLVDPLNAKVVVERIATELKDDIEASERTASSARARRPFGDLDPNAQPSGSFDDQAPSA